jgi:hypothetical protein
VGDRSISILILLCWSSIDHRLDIYSCDDPPGVDRWSWGISTSAEVQGLATSRSTPMHHHQAMLIMYIHHSALLFGRSWIVYQWSPIVACMFDLWKGHMSNCSVDEWSTLIPANTTDELKSYTYENSLAYMIYLRQQMLLLVDAGTTSHEYMIWGRKISIWIGRKNSSTFKLNCFSLDPECSSWVCPPTHHDHHMPNP